MEINLIRFGWDFFLILRDASQLLWGFFMSNVDENIAEFFGISASTTNLEFLMVVGITIALVAMAIRTIVGVFG